LDTDDAWGRLFRGGILFELANFPASGSGGGAANLGGGGPLGGEGSRGGVGSLCTVSPLVLLLGGGAGGAPRTELMLGLIDTSESLREVIGGGGGGGALPR
jgi:hypothetical protein